MTKLTLSVFAMLALGGCTWSDADRWAAAGALMGVSAALSNYGAAIASQPVYYRPSVYCYPVGRGTLCQ